MAAAAPSASMGLLTLGGCGVLPPRVPDSGAGHGFLVSRRRVSVAPLGWGLVRKGKALDPRIAGLGAAGALASGEAGAGSSELRHIEKELTFSPTFTDYVKIMESVKLDRSKSLRGDGPDGRSPRRRFMGNGDASVFRGGERNSDDIRSKSFRRDSGYADGNSGDRRSKSFDRGNGVHRGKGNADGNSGDRRSKSFDREKGAHRGRGYADGNSGDRRSTSFDREKGTRMDRRYADGNSGDGRSRSFDRENGAHRGRGYTYGNSVDGRSRSFDRENGAHRGRGYTDGNLVDGRSRSFDGENGAQRGRGYADENSGDRRSTSFDREKGARMERGYADGNSVDGRSKSFTREKGTHRGREYADWNSGDGRSKSFDRENDDHRDRRYANGRGMKLANSDNRNNGTRLVDNKTPGDSEMSHGRQLKVEEYVQRRIVRGELRETGGNVDNNDRRQFTPHLKTEDTRGSVVVHQSMRNKHVQLNAHNDLQGRTASIVSRTSAPPDRGAILKDTKPMVKVRTENFNSVASSMHEKKVKCPREGNSSNYEVNTDGKFQRYQQRAETSGRNPVVSRFIRNGMDYNKPNVSNRYGNIRTMPEHDGDPSDSVKRRKPEAIGMQRGGNVQTGKFLRRDAKATEYDDRAAFKTFEVFTDVRNRPRVLQMELEERIQKLASQLNATDVNTPEWKFSKMIHDAKIKFSDHSILRIVQILGRYGNWKRVLQIVEWLQSRERFESYKSRYIYTTVLDVLGKAKRPFEALNVFYTMLDQLSSYPDMAAYHCIAVTLGQAGLVKELFDVIDCMRSPPRKKFKLGPLQNWDPRSEPDLIVYNAVLNACVQQKQWEGAFWVLQQLKEKNIRPTNTTYGLVMEVMLVCGKYNLVYEIFNKVKKTSIPGALNYKVLVNALWREGNIDEAVKAVKDMENRGIVGSASLYYDLARCLCSGGRCKEALLQVEKICKVANKPLVVTYTGLIQTCIDSGSMENAKYIFDEMCSYCSPNNVTCNIMLKSYLEHGMFEDAKELLDTILNGRLRSKSESSQKAIADKFTFNTFMEACAEAKKWDDFEYAFREMLSNGYHFDDRRHLRMVLDAYRNGKEQLLEDVWDYLCQYGRVPPAPMIMERFCLKLKKGNTTAAISCISTYEDSKIRNVSSMSWFNLLSRNADRLEEENITKLVDELNNLVSSRGSSHSLYQIILSSCTEFLSGAIAEQKAPSDRQMLPCNS